MHPIDPSTFLSKTSTLHDALVAIDSGEHGLAVVTDTDERLLGILTQYEIRKALLRGATLEDPCWPFVNQKPIIASVGLSNDELQRVFQDSHRRVIPLVNSATRVVGFETINSARAFEPADGKMAVIMAGGLGKRLGTLTAEHPKPLLPIGERPLLQIIIEELKNCGFTQIFVAVNYKRDMIKASLGDGVALGVEIHYLCEDAPLGTAGGLSLLSQKPKDPFLIMNGDLLTRVNFAGLLDYHIHSGERLTVGIQRHDYQVPFGVVKFDAEHITSIDEKPINTWFVNAGIYAMNPEILDLLKNGERCDMPELISRTVELWGSVGGFPIYEYWLDIGQPADLIQAKNDYRRYF